MTSTQQIIDQEIAQFGWVDLIATNSIIDFNSSKSKGSKTITFEKESDVKDIFICNLIFYLVSCYSLLIHVFIDLVFASYLGKKVNKYFNVK